jgi:DNA-binding CsgD family transcriptional regulator
VLRSWTFSDQANPTALPGRAGSIAGRFVVCVALIAPLSTASAWSVHVRRRTTLVQREALALRLVEPAAWLITASWWLTLVITMVTGDSLNALPAQALAVIVLAATAWVAIRRYRLFDTRLAISRVLAYGSLSVCVIAVYLAVAASVEVVASDVVSAPIAVLAAVLVALPLRDLLARGTNRLVYGYRDDCPSHTGLASVSAPCENVPKGTAGSRCSAVSTPAPPSPYRGGGHDEHCAARRRNRGKGAAPDDIVRAITAVAAGEVILGAALAVRISDFFQSGARQAAKPFPALSSREHDVLNLIAAGHSNSIIAERLALSEKTIRNNVSSIFAKLQVADRSAAIVRAREAGLGSP